MKISLTALCLMLAIQVFGQFETFPVYRLTSVDSIKPVDFCHIKTINVKNDTIKINVDTEVYFFISSRAGNNSTQGYPAFIANYDDKFNFEIRSWEIVEIQQASVTFRLAYTKRHKKNGSQKGKYYIIDNYRIDKDQIAGVYAGQLNKEQNKNINLINLGLAGAVILLAVLTVESR